MQKVRVTYRCDNDHILSAELGYEIIAAMKGGVCGESRNIFRSKINMVSYTMLSNTASIIFSVINDFFNNSCISMTSVFITK